MTYSHFRSIKDVHLLREELANDPTSVTKKLRDACDFLEHSQQGTAYDPLGVLVALFSPRMPSIIWTVLFQKLRESDSIKIKLSIFQHFVHVSEYIPAVEKANAFRIFAQETVLLLSKEEVMVDISFKNSFRLIVESLGMYSEKEFSSQMLGVMVNNMQIWKQSDLLRANAFLTSLLVCFTNGYETPIPFLYTIKKRLSLYAFSLVLDACAPFIIDRSQRLAENGATYPEFMHLKGLLDEAMSDCFLANKMELTQPIPSLISCFVKLKEFDLVFSLSQEADVCQHVLLALENTKTRKLLVSSLLSFLQKTRINWWRHVDIVFSYSLTGDSATRSYAFLAIANAVEAIEEHEILNIQPMLFDLCSHFIQKHCVMTVCGILTVFKTSFLKLATRRRVIEDLFYQLFALVSEAPISLKYSCSVELLVLDLIQISGVYSFDLLLYVIRCFDSDYAAVQKGGLNALFAWCSTQIIDESFLESVNFGRMDFFEKSWYCDAPQMTINQLSPYHLKQNLKTMAFFFLDRLCEAVSDSGKLTAAENACTAIIALDEFSKSHIIMDDHPLTYIMASFEILITNMLSYSGMESLSTFIKLMQASTSCLAKSSNFQPISTLSHKDLFNLMCSIIFYCSQIVDPCVSYEFESNVCFYGAFVPLPSIFSEAMQNLFLSALHNTEPFKNTDFYAFLDATFLFITRLIEVGVHSCVFIQHLRKPNSVLLKCISTFVETNPQGVFKFINAFVKLIFPSPREHESDIFSKRDFLDIFSSIRHCIIRGFSLDLFLVGPVLFELLIFFIELDCSSNSTQTYVLLDTDFSLVEIIISELLVRKTYAPRYGFDIVEILLRTILKLVKSPYKSRVALLITSEKYSCIVKIFNCESNDLNLTILNTCKEYLSLISNELLLTDRTEERPFGTLTTCIQDRTSLSSFFGLLEAFCGLNGSRIEIDHLLPYGWDESPYFLVLKASNDYRLVDKAIKALLHTRCEEWLKCLMVIVIVNFLSHSRPDWGNSGCFLWKKTEASRQVIHFLMSHNGQDSFLPVPDHNYVPAADCTKGLKPSQDRSTCARFCHVSCNLDVSFVLDYIPYGVCAISAAPLELVVEDYLTDLTVTDMFECCSRETGLSLFYTLYNENKLDKINVYGVVALAQCLMRSKIRRDRHVTLKSIAFAEHLESLLDSVSSANNDFVKCFRYSALFLLAWFYFDREDHNPYDENILLSNIPLCLKIVQYYGFHSIKRLDNVVETVLERLSVTDELNSVEESTLLLLVRIFGGTFHWCEWLQSLFEQGTPGHFKACLKVSQVLSFSLSTWLDVKMIVSNVLQHDKLDSNVSTDRQRYSLWLLSSTLCHSENDGLSDEKPIFQTRFSDSRPDFSKFFRKGLLNRTVSILFDTIHEDVLPSFMKRGGSFRHRQNLHYQWRVLPLCGCLNPQGLSNTRKKDLYMDLLQFYLQTVETTFSHTQRCSPIYFYDMIGSLAIICSNGGIGFNMSLWQAKLVPLFTPFLNHLLGYLKSFESASVNPSKLARTSVLSEHTGFFLRPISFTKFCDTLSLTITCKLLCCRALRIADDQPFTVDGLLSSLIKNLMLIDHFTYLAAHSCISLLGSNSSILKRMTWLPSYCFQNFIEELQLAASWGYLSFSLGAMQLLRTACVVASSWPDDEGLCSKICEGLWNSVLKVTLSRALTFNGYELMRVLISNTLVGGRQWDMLRILITDDWRESFLTETLEIPTVFGGDNSSSRNENSPNHSTSGEPQCSLLDRFSSERNVLDRLLLDRVHVERMVTQAFLLLRNEQDATSKEAGVENQSVLVSRLLDHCHVLNEAELLCLEVLITDAIAKDHYNIFFFLNHFKMLPATRRVYMCVLLFMLHRHMLKNVGQSGEYVITLEVPNLLFTFLECAVKGAAHMSDVVWVITALLISLISFQNIKVSRAMALAVLPPQPQAMYEMLSRAIVKFLARGPLRYLVVQILSQMRENVNTGSVITPCIKTYISSLLNHIDH